jgi:hypothetical protein
MAVPVSGAAVNNRASAYNFTFARDGGAAPEPPPGGRKAPRPPRLFPKW